MVMLTDSRRHCYEIGPELGRGGEGVVSEVVGLPSLLAKIYYSAKALSPSRVEKLEYQCEVGDDELRRIAAWPQSMLYMGNAAVGFLMPRMMGRPIHQLYRPVDRKEHFPGVSWQGLVRVCQNIASAFHALHSRSIVMADVNETNVYVGVNGEIRLIDCDSYQIAGRGGRVYGCDVGTPMWTPPELQGRDLGKCLRTEQHDLFGLAVLMFHLLFMGRHPFAGVPRTSFGLDSPPMIESSIAARSFPFGRRVECAQGVPPHSLTLSALPASIGALFEDAFLGAARPTAATWFRQLGEVSFQACRWGHVFARELSDCPWCRIWEDGGPNFFLTMQNAAAAGEWVGEVERLLAEIGAAVFPLLRADDAGVAAVIMPPWHAPSREGLVPPAATPTAMQEPEVRPAFVWGVIGIVFCVVGAFLSPRQAALFVACGVVSAAMVVGGRRYPEDPGVARRRHIAVSATEAEVRSKVSELCDGDSLWRLLFERERREAVIGIRDFRRAMESKWSDMRQELMVALKAVVSDLRALPSREKFMMEERRRTSQLDDFLRRHHIARQKIPDIGPVRSAMLAKYGIETAWDVKNMGYVPRLGAGEVSLKLWVAGIESRFVYKASAPLSEVAKQDIRRDIAKSEDGIRKRFNDIIEGWMRMRRESDVARLQAILDRQVEERKAALAAIGKSAGAANQQLLEQLDGALRKWGQAVADAAVCPPLT